MYQDVVTVPNFGARVIADSDRPTREAAPTT